MCYTGKCPYEYGRDGDMCKALEQGLLGNMPDDAWCEAKDDEEE